MAKATWKLVRDRIPAIIGDGAEYKVLNDNDYSKALAKKLDEETKELKQELAMSRSNKVQLSEGKPGLDPYNTDRIVDELSDVLEVCAAIAEYHKLDNEALFNAAAKKREEKGGFLKRFYLKITK